jgi:hypothetical protein
MRVGTKVVSTQTIQTENCEIPGGCPGVIHRREGNGQFVVKFDFYDREIYGFVEKDDFVKLPRA